MGEAVVLEESKMGLVLLVVVQPRETVRVGGAESQSEARRLYYTYDQHDVNSTQVVRTYAHCPHPIS